MRSKLPQRFGPYILLKELGKGAVGAAYLARRINETALVVLKCLHPWHIASEERMKRFRHEALIAVSVDSPHVVKVLDVGSVGDTPYLAMEYVAGWTLSELLTAFGRLKEYPSLPSVLELALDGLRGLSALHLAKNPETGAPLGVVHRDISPSNLMLHRDGRLLVIDLGLGRSNAQEWQTRAGMLMGTPGYMAPEQAMSDRVDHRADLYSFSVLIWELLVVRHFIERGDRAAMVAEMQSPVFRKPSEIRPGTPPALDEILRRALAIAPDDRFASAEELASAISSLGFTGHLAETSTMSLPKALFDALARRDAEIAHFARLDFEGAPEAELEATRNLEPTRVIATRVQPDPSDPDTIEPSVITRVLAPVPHEAVLTLEDSAVRGSTMSLTWEASADDTLGDTILRSGTAPMTASTSTLRQRLTQAFFLTLLVVMIGLTVSLVRLVNEPVLVQGSAPGQTPPQPSVASEPVPHAKSTPSAEPELKPEAPRTTKKEPHRSARAAPLPTPQREPEVSQAEPSLDHGFRTLIKDASDLRRADPSLAAEVDSILYDASIWSRSTDTKNAAIQLQTLRAKLAQLRK